MDLTFVEIIDWCIYGLEEGNPEGVPPLLKDFKKKLQELDDNADNVCPLCGKGKFTLNRFSGIEIDDYKVFNE